MAHDRDDKYDGQEDGEYHFSDDQFNYDMEPELEKPAAAKASAKAPALALNAGNVKNMRKPIIGVVVFVLLIFLVYKITAPTNTAQTAPGDFAQNAGTVSNQKPTMRQLPKPIKVAQNTQSTPAATNNEFQPLAPANSMSAGTPAGVPATNLAPQTQAATQPLPAPVVEQPVATTTVTTTTTTPTSTPAPEQPAVATTTTTTATTPAPLAEATPSVPNLQAPAPAENYYNPAHPNANSNVTVVNGNSPANDPITTLEQANAKLTADVNQKLADTQAQNTALEGKLQDLNMRLASIESTLAHLSKAIQETHPATPLSSHQASAAMPQQRADAAVRAAFSVQAIIPGRAWLKAENGETITVAEGDILKNYGRILKIDPYDGIVQVDVNGRVMTLSYGVTSE